MTDVTTPFVCAVDQTPHESLEALHRYLQFKLKIRQEVYYKDYAPRLDRCTGEPIPFKAPASEYLKREFRDKNTLLRWFKQSPEEAHEWALRWLRTRKEDKGLTYAPCQVELRSLMCPSVVYWRTQPGGYTTAAEGVGYKIQFPDRLPDPLPQLDCPAVIDTREQKPLWNPDKPQTTDPPCQWGTLKTADYGLPPEHDQQIYIERKSIADLICTLSARETRYADSNLARFTRELERGTEIGAYIVMLVEQSLNDCLAFNSIPYLHDRFSNVKVTPDHLFHNLRDLFHEFPHSFQALFVRNRTEAAAAVPTILALGDTVRTIDLQAEYDLGRWRLS